MRARTVRSSSALGGICASALLLTACGTQTGPPGSGTNGQPGSGTVHTADHARASISLDAASAIPDVVSAGDKLGLDLIALAEPDANAVTSPASAQIALSMASEGADGDTLKQLETIIGAAGQQRTDAVNAMSLDLADLDGDPSIVQDDKLPDPPMVHLANHVVTDDGAAIKASYLDKLATNYGAGADSVDLGSDAGKALLDQWVRKNTGGLIEKSAIEPDPTLKLVLQNAVVLAARWESPFPAAVTQDQDFTLADGTVVPVPMMSYGAVTELSSVKEQGWRAVRLPYQGGRLHADIVLPPKGAAPADATAELLSTLSEKLDHAKPSPVMFSMPKVDTSTTTELMPYLEEHAPAALAGGFNGIADGLAVSQAAQQAVLDIDEKGTVAAAVTELGFRESASIGAFTVVTVDRPYLVRIADTHTGWSLFLAKIADPRDA